MVVLRYTDSDLESVSFASSIEQLTTQFRFPAIEALQGTRCPEVFGLVNLVKFQTFLVEEIALVSPRRVTIGLLSL